MNITPNIGKILFLTFYSFATAPLSQDAMPLPVGSVETITTSLANTDIHVPIDKWDGKTVPVVTITGTQSLTVWKSSGSDLTLAQISEPILAHFLQQGFALRLDCEEDQCGGFDFRFALTTAKAPALFVNLRDYRFLSFTKGPLNDPMQVANILVTKAFGAIYVQLEQATNSGTSVKQTQVNKTVPAVQPSVSFATTGALDDDLNATGRAILSDLEYASGSSKLAQNSYESLAELKIFLDQNPDKDIVLVGHSDNIGSLAGNMSLAKKRAQSVVDLLVTQYGVSKSRVSAQGVGFLSPLTTNDTQQGRDTNRRVEVIIAPPK